LSYMGVSVARMLHPRHEVTQTGKVIDA